MQGGKCDKTLLVTGLQIIDKEGDDHICLLLLCGRNRMVTPFDAIPGTRVTGHPTPGTLVPGHSFYFLFYFYFYFGGSSFF